MKRIANSQRAKNMLQFSDIDNSAMSYTIMSSYLDNFNETVLRSFERSCWFSLIHNRYPIDNKSEYIFTNGGVKLYIVMHEST